MKNRKRTTLFWRYFSFISAVILICYIILGSALLIFVSRFRINEKEKLLMENADSVAATAAELIGTLKNDSRSVILICNTLSLVSKAVDADIFITNMDGKVILCRDMLKSGAVGPGGCIIHGNTMPAAIMREVADSGGYSEITNLDGIYEKRHFVVSHILKVNGRNAGAVFAVQPIGAFWSYILSVLKIVAFSSLVSLMLAFSFVYYMTYRLTKPLRQMSAAIKSYSKGDFSYRVETNGDDELSELSAAFNSMAKSLATLEGSRRNFVANVSHELKTPMTTIGGFIDGILDGTIEKKQHDYYLRIVSEEVKRLSRLVTSMLSLSKMETGKFELNYKKFNLSEQVFKTLLAFERLIEEKGIQITGLENMESVYLTADEDLINQVIYNLVDNAVKFTPPGGTIEIEIKPESERVLTRIKNTGEGIPSEEIGRIFERFYKTDKSRSHDVRGAGLGLYIVKSIVEMHGGQISVSSAVDEFTEFIFTIPLNR